LAPISQHLQDYRFYLMSEDTVAALNELHILRNIEPKNNYIKSKWMLLNLKKGHIDKVLELSIDEIEMLSSKMLYADAYALTGKWVRADSIMHVITLNADSLAYLQRQVVNVRSNKQLWLHYLDLVYKNELFKPTAYSRLNYFLQILAAKQAIEQEQWHLFTLYIAGMSEESLNRHFFNVYLEISHYLGFRGEFDLAWNIIDRLSSKDTRKRYKRRLHKQKQWLMFLLNLEH